MNTRTVVPLLSLVCLLLSACGKEAVEVDHNYVGFWKNVSSECRPVLNIMQSGEATYNAKWADESCKHDREHSGEAKIKNGQLHIGGWHERITLPPTAIDPVLVDVQYEYGSSRWSTMKLELSGLTYYRIEP